MTTTQPGRILRQELNDAFQRLALKTPNYPYIPLEQSADVSLLARRAKRYAGRAEAACSYEWANEDGYELATTRLEKLITELALTIPGVEGVTFQGDPRGYVVRLQLVDGLSNTMGDDGWGIG